MPQDETETQVPDVEYDNVESVRLREGGVLEIQTAGQGHPPENGNPELLPDDESYEQAIEAFVGGVDKVRFSQFAEPIHELMVMAEELEMLADGKMKAKFRPEVPSNYPNIRFREHHGKLVAVVTHKSHV